MLEKVAVAEAAKEPFNAAREGGESLLAAALPPLPTDVQRPKAGVEHLSSLLERLGKGPGYLSERLWRGVCFPAQRRGAPPDSPPAMLQLRVARSSDVDKLTGLIASTWEQTYTQLMPRAVLKECSPDMFGQQLQRIVGPSDLQRACVLMIESPRGPIGTAACGPYRPEEYPDLRLKDLRPPIGELYRLYVAPEHQSLGLGRLLLTTRLLFLHRELGVKTALAWALADNQPVRRLFKRMGGRLIGNGGASPAGSYKVREVCYAFDTDTVVKRLEARLARLQRAAGKNL